MARQRIVAQRGVRFAPALGSPTGGYRRSGLCILPSSHPSEGSAVRVFRSVEERMQIFAAPRGHPTQMNADTYERAVRALLKSSLSLFYLRESAIISENLRPFLTNSRFFTARGMTSGVDSPRHNPLLPHGRNTSGPTSCSRAPAMSRGSSRIMRVTSLKVKRTSTPDRAIPFRSGAPTSMRRSRCEPCGTAPKRLIPKLGRMGVPTPKGASPAHNRAAWRKAPTPTSPRLVRPERT